MYIGVINEYFVVAEIIRIDGAKIIQRVYELRREKTGLGGSDKVRHKPACTVSEKS